MGDFYPVADIVKPQDPNQAFSSMNNILGLQRQRQELQSGALTIQSQEAQLVPQQQKAQEIRQGGALMMDPVNSGITDSEGNPTKNAYAIIKRAMPFTGDDHYKDILGNAKMNLDYKGSFNQLRRDARTDVSARLAGVAADPQNGVPEFHDAIDNIEKDYAGTPAEDQIKTITGVTRDAVDAAVKHHGPDGARNVIMAFSRGGFGNAGITGAGGVATPAATTVNNNGVIQPGVQAPPLQGGGFTPGGPGVPVTTAPANMVGPNGQIIRVPAGGAGLPSTGGAPGNGAPQDNGGGSAPAGTLGPSGAPAQAPGSSGASPGGALGPSGAPVQSRNQLQPLQRPGINAPAAEQENYKTQIAQAGQHYQAIQGAANDPMNGVQATRFRNQQILDLIPHANTGPYLKMLNTMASRLPNSSGDAYQDIEHYTAQNSAALAKTMGVPGTNLGAETAAAAAGSVEKNPGALAEITKTNDALNTALSLYNRGLAKVSNNGSDPSRVNAFRQAFGQNLDINAVRWADAHRRKDATEIKALQDKYGKDGVAGFAAKLKVLNSLSENGALP